MGVAQTTIGTGSGSNTVSANTATSPSGNVQPIAPLSGIGAHSAIPTSGTGAAPVAIGTVPEGAVAARLYAPPGVTIPFCVAPNATAAAQAFAAGAFHNYAQSTDGPNWDENLNGQNIYVGAITGNPGTPSATAPAASFRYI